MKENRNSNTGDMLALSFSGFAKAASVAATLVTFGLCPAGAQQPQAIPVGTVTAERRPVEKALDFVGRVEAVGRVEVRARVKGFLDAVLFKEGEFVKAGAPLFTIEKGLFEADVKQAEGAVERDTAAKSLTEIQLSRASELLTKQSGTAVARDQARAADQQAQGQLTSDQANLKTAKINLGYTDITSPIDGKVGRTNVTKGNVVGPDSGPLTVIVSQDPMYVTFPVSQREFLRVEARDASRWTSARSRRGLRSSPTARPMTRSVDQLRRRHGRSRDGHRAGARDHAQSRRAARSTGSWSRVASRADKSEEKVAGAAGGADRRSAGDLCLHGRGRQGGRSRASSLAAN